MRSQGPRRGLAPSGWRSPSCAAAIRARRPTHPVTWATGPATAAWSCLDYWLDEAAALRAERDIILLDQRGTGCRSPACAAGNSKPSSARPRPTRCCPTGAGPGSQTAAACRNRLLAGGVNLAAYNTAATAADVKDLRRGAGHWRVEPVRPVLRHAVALTVLRDYPRRRTQRGARSRPQPLQTGGGKRRPPTPTAPSSRLFAGCARRPVCDRRLSRVGRPLLRHGRTGYDVAPLNVSSARPGHRPAWARCW